MTRHPSTFGHLVFAPKVTRCESWWIGRSRDGFTVACAAAMNVVVPIGDSGDRIVAMRRHQLSALIGLATAKATVGVMHANVVGK